MPSSTTLVVPEQVRYRPRLHAAVRTRDYLYAQLLPYLGNKRKLLPLICRGLAETGCRGGVFVDLFTGSTVVARLAKTLGFRVLANDWEPYSYAVARGTVALNRVPAFARFGGAEQAFERLNSLPPQRGYVSRNLCPRDDEDADPDRERMFFTRRNGGRIDAMRETVADWETRGWLDADERDYVLSALVYAVSYASNTSGVFKAYHRGWGGRTATALYRILAELRLAPPVVHDNGLEHLACREDAAALAPDLARRLGERPAIVYLDPPYNQHPYGSNYHVLNTVTLCDSPPLPAPTRVNGRLLEKSAIRRDWRTARRSPYNHRERALPAFRELLAGLDARWLLVSYSTDGNMPLEGLLSALAERGALSLHTQKYKRYRVSAPRRSPRPHNIEFLAVVDTARRSSRRQAEAWAARLRSEGRAAGAGSAEPAPTGE